MKKHLLGFLAMAFAIALSSFTAPQKNIISFHFLPPDGAEIYYEDPDYWEVSNFSWECNGTPNDVCILKISADYLYYYSGTQPERLAAFMADQGVGSSSFINATHAVSVLTYSMKP